MYNDVPDGVDPVGWSSLNENQRNLVRKSRDLWRQHCDDGMPSSEELAKLHDAMVQELLNMEMEMIEKIDKVVEAGVFKEKVITDVSAVQMELIRNKKIDTVCKWITIGAVVAALGFIGKALCSRK